MIPVEKEKHARKLLERGRTVAHIATETGLSQHTVRRIRTICELNDSVDPMTRDDICKYLRDGLPVGSISYRTGVEPEKVRAVRRHNYLRKYNAAGSEPAACPACGAYVFPEEYISEGVDSITPEHFNQEDARNLYKIATELVNLYGLHLIGNVIFCNLAGEARGVILKIGERNDKEATEGN